MGETNPMDILLDEHAIIKKAASLSLRAGSLIGSKPAQYEQVIRLLLFFFREYADKFHHYKEESILFPSINKKNEVVGIILTTEMETHHKEFRDTIQNIETRLNEKKYRLVDEELHAYTSMLLDHIAVEDEEVFPAGSSLLNQEENRSMYYQFCDLDRELGESKKRELENSLKEIEALIIL